MAHGLRGWGFFGSGVRSFGNGPLEFFIGREGKDPVRYFTQFSVTELMVSEISRMGFDDFSLSQLKAIIVSCWRVAEKSLGIRDMALCPFELVHFGEVLDQILVGVKTVFDLAEIDDSSTGQLLPLVADDGVRKEAVADETDIRPHRTCGGVA
jgi:hypothetical protein